MSQPTELGPPPVDHLHCLICGRIVPCTPGELRGHVEHDESWPRCCGARMAVAMKGEGDDPGTGGVGV